MVFLEVYQNLGKVVIEEKFFMEAMPHLLLKFQLGHQEKRVFAEN